MQHWHGLLLSVLEASWCDSIQRILFQCIKLIATLSALVLNSLNSVVYHRPSSSTSWHHCIACIGLLVSTGHPLVPHRIGPLVCGMQTRCPTQRSWLLMSIASIPSMLQHSRMAVFSTLPLHEMLHIFWRHQRWNWSNFFSCSDCTRSTFHCHIDVWNKLLCNKQQFLQWGEFHSLTRAFNAVFQRWYLLYLILQWSHHLNEHSTRGSHQGSRKSAQPCSLPILMTGSWGGEFGFGWSIIYLLNADSETVADWSASEIIHNTLKVTLRVGHQCTVICKEKLMQQQG